MRHLIKYIGALFICGILSLPVEALSPACLDTKTTDEFAAYIETQLRQGDLKELEFCFQSFKTDSEQLNFLQSQTQAGHAMSTIAFYSTTQQEGDSRTFSPDHFAEFVRLLGELEFRLTQGDAKYNGLRQRILDVQGNGGMTVFHHVITIDLPPYAEILLDAKADTYTIRERGGFTAAELAQLFDQIEQQETQPGQSLKRNKVHCTLNPNNCDGI